MNRRIKSGWNLETETEPTLFDHVIAAMVSVVALLIGGLALWGTAVILVAGV